MASKVALVSSIDDCKSKMGRSIPGVWGGITKQRAGKGALCLNGAVTAGCIWHHVLQCLILPLCAKFIAVKSNV